MFEIKIGPNQGAFFEQYSVYPLEKEILLPAFCEFKILKISSTDTLKWFLQMECLYVNTQNYTKGMLNDLIFRDLEINFSLASHSSTHPNEGTINN